MYVRIEPLVDVEEILVNHKFRCLFIREGYPITSGPFFDHSNSSFHPVDVFISCTAFNMGVDSILNFAEFSIGM